jgi:MarR family transcriptional regulator, transcriptional regulator for hemolysin
LNSYLTLFELIGKFARKRYQMAERHFAVLGLNHTEARLLTLLSRAGGEATQEALSNMLFIDRSNAGRALKGLEEAGLVIRRKDETDKRTNLVQMTEGGYKAVAEVAKLRQKMAQTFFGSLTEEQAGTIVSLLENAFESEELGRTSS